MFKATILAPTKLIMGDNRIETEVFLWSTAFSVMVDAIGVSISNTYLLTKQRAEQIKAPPEPTPIPDPLPVPGPDPVPVDPNGGEDPPTPQKAVLRLTGTVPMESWNTVGVRILTKLRSEEGLNIGVNVSVSVDSDRLKGLEDEVRQALADLKLDGQVNMTTDL